MATVSTGQSRSLLYAEVHGLDEIVRNFRLVNQEGDRIVTSAIADSGNIVLASAMAKASSFSASGAFRSTLSIKKVRNGITLSSNDKAAGVIEFANLGARTRTSKGTKIADARLAKGSGVGVPRGASNPRSMVPSVNENTLRVQNKVADALERALHGNS